MSDSITTSCRIGVRETDGKLHVKNLRVSMDADDHVFIWVGRSGSAIRAAAATIGDLIHMLREKWPGEWCPNSWEEILRELRGVSDEGATIKCAGLVDGIAQCIQEILETRRDL